MQKFRKKTLKFRPRPECKDFAARTFRKKTLKFRPRSEFKDFGAQHSGKKHLNSDLGLNLMILERSIQEKTQFKTFRKKTLGLNLRIWERSIQEKIA